MEENKIFFTPGDLCILKLDIPNKPIMLITKIERSYIKNPTTDHTLLRGVKTRWFTKDGFLQEAIFSTKDLEKYEG